MPGTPSKLVGLVSVVALAALGLATLVMNAAARPAAGAAASGSLDCGDVVHLPGRSSRGRAGWTGGRMPSSR